MSVDGCLMLTKAAARTIITTAAVAIIAALSSVIFIRI